ncbi:hypothetical protein ACLB2K_032161 [Fragaria x ananassa]
MSHYDPRTSQSEIEVQRILDLQKVTNSMLDSFTDIVKVMRSTISAANVPARLEVPKTVQVNATLGLGTTGGGVAMASAPTQKRGRPKKGSIDVLPWKKQDIKAQNDQLIINTVNPLNEIVFDYSYVHESILKPLEDASELMLIADWSKWKDAIQAELDSLLKRQVFGPVVPCPPNVKPIGHKWVFVRKRNEKNEVMRYKARLVAQGFLQRPGIDYEETYSPIMDIITFRYLIEAFTIWIKSIQTNVVYSSE